MEENKKAFGHRYLDIFNVGDLVSWKNLDTDDKSFGFVINIYVDGSFPNDENRTYAFAVVQKLNGATENFMLSNLNLEATNKREVPK